MLEEKKATKGYEYSSLGIWDFYLFGTYVLETHVSETHFFLFVISIFGPLRASFRSFSSIFFFILWNSSVCATRHNDGLTNMIFDTESLYDTIMWAF